MPSERMPSERVPSERAAPTPVAFRLTGWPAPVAFPFKAPQAATALFPGAAADPLQPLAPPRQGGRAALLGSTSLDSGIVAATDVGANVAATPHAQ
jgi:hypothetical protein